MKIDKSKWTKVKFGDVCTLVNENTKDAKSDGLKYLIGLEHIEPNNLHLRSWSTTDTETTFTRIFRKGQVLFGRRRAYQRKIAYAEFDGICSGDIMVFQAKEKILRPELLPFVVQSDGFFQCAVDTSAGSLSPRTKFNDLSNYEFLLPPKEEQACLAELLWAADEVVEREKEELMSIDAFQTNYLKKKHEDVSQPLISFSDLIDVNPRTTKNSNKKLLASFISMSDVSNEGSILNKEDKPIEELEGNGYTPFEENDILFAKITPCMENGKGAIAKDLSNGLGFGSTEFHVLRAKIKEDTKFCFYLSKMDSFRQLAERLMTGSAGQKRVQSDFFDHYKFHTPKLHDRFGIGEKMDMLENRKSEIKKQIELSQQLKSVLINQIFKYKQYGI
jgi:type I restriction enzyme S subunit